MLIVSRNNQSKDKRVDTNPDRPRIVEVAVDDEQMLAYVVRLHMELLDFGPMAGLGERFIREVGYKLHMKDGLMKAALCLVGEQPAGFVVYTSRSISFHRQSLSAHLLRVLWVLTLSLVEDPRRIVKLLRAVRVIASRRRENRRGSDPMGEVIAIAVRREYLSKQYVDENGRRPSVSLVAYAQKELLEMGVDEMRMLVDADNKSALFLYHGLGARLEGYEQAGEPMVEVWFDLRSPNGGTQGLPNNGGS